MTPMLLRNARNSEQVFAHPLSVPGPGPGWQVSRLFKQAVQGTALQTLIF